jgi:phosphomannomutase/phosphoglucomutase
MTPSRPGLSAAPDDIAPGIFRASDIRGIAGKDLNRKVVERIGKAMASMAREDGEDTVLFGADGRLSSPELRSAVLQGILSTGLNVVDLGIIPTPLLYFASFTTPWTSGLMLTASHNPAAYNGIKIIRRRHCLTPQQIQEIRLRAESGHFLTGVGVLRRHELTTDYIAHLQSRIRLQRPLKVVVDCASAVPALVAPALFRALGCEVIPLFCELDGHFPHHPPDPTVAGNLAALIDAVAQHGADAGIALDGDGDRVVVVTERGTPVDTDRLLMLFIQDILPRSERGSRVVYDVKCSTQVPRLIAALGGTPVMSRSGHSFMKQSMQDSGAVIGAEFSAHVFIRDDWFGYDDGLYVAARFLELLARSDATAEALLATLPRSVVTPELRIEVSDERKFDLMARIIARAHFPGASVNVLDGLRVDFADGWGLIRASNTTPALLLRFEACSQQALSSIQALFRELLRQVDGQLLVDFQ